MLPLAASCAASAGSSMPRSPTAPRRILDNLPIGIVRMREDNGEQVKTYERGFPVGFQDVRRCARCGPAPCLA